MTPYEVVRRAIEFKKPDRLPLRFEALGLSDVHLVLWNQVGAGDRQQSRTVDEWGCEWVRDGVANMGQVKGHPLADWAALKQYRWPDPDNPAFYEGMAQKFDAAGDRYVLTSTLMLLFERMWALHGFEATLADLYLERERLEWLADRIVDFDLGLIDNLARRFPGRLHGFRFTDDWGSQQATLIDPELWRAFFKPRYRRIFEAAHRQGWHVWMHSDGKINAILEDLIEIGLDVINLQQPRVLDIDQIGQRFRGRICFESLCDIQATLPRKDAQAIRAEARLLLEKWSTPEGGFILSDYLDEQAIGIDREQKEIMLAAFLEAGPNP